ncbi:hypothetical protein DC522_05460 [Microvirga sp. KLBC 81]|uniref:hypothetical protein n=1 Tax=Microvirga sp. KLBC 81 TaxID=1862707 RepID=UPI000D51614B|nr:hypothetical protein [Microvirga sp. KLBC 81]PVE25350.1 hypothetical protein DC522_05460 [Microvirga sp. KLBC 81]
MNTAILSSVYAGQTRTPSTFSLIVKGMMSALAESRARSAARELRRHKALMADLGRRQDHSADFLIQSNDLPFKI